MRLSLFVPAQRPALHEPGPTSLREADVDNIEVLRDHGLRKHGTGLADDLGSEVAVRQMGEREEAHSGRRRKLGRARRRGMESLVRALALLDGERRLVNEDFGVAGCLEHRAGGARVSCKNNLPAGPRRAKHLLWAHGRAVGQLHRLPGLEAPEKWALRDPEPFRGLEVEPARARLLDECVAVGGDAVLHGERLDPVVVPPHGVSRHQLDERELVAQAAKHATQDPEELLQPRRAVDGQRDLAPPEGERLQHPRKAEVMVGVVVRQEDLGQLHEPHGGAQQLTLCALAAVDKDPLSAAAKQRTREAALRSRHRARGSEENEIEIHGRSLGATALKSDSARADF